MAAFKAVDPSPDALQRLMEQLDAGHITTFVEPIRHDQPVALSLPGAPWRYQEDSVSRLGLKAAIVECAGPRLAERIPMGRGGIRALDREIAVHSGYRLSSLRRLAWEFLGEELDPHSDSLRAELVAPWPLQKLRADVDGSRLRVELGALPGAEREHVVLNVECAGRDVRATADALQWIRVAGGGLVTHVGMLDLSAMEPHNVNAYYQGLDEVWLQAPIVRSNALATRQPTAAAETLATIEDLSSAPVPGATLRRLHVEMFRSLRDVTLDLEPLTVLVGPNQAGKSTVLDVLDLLGRGAAKQLYDAIVRRRGGFARIVWRGEEWRSAASRSIQIDADFRDDTGAMLRYEVIIGPVGADDYAVEHERIFRKDADRWQLRLRVDHGRAEVQGRVVQASDRRELFLAQTHGLIEIPELDVIRAALASMAVYPHFTTTAAWAEPEAAGMRAPARPEPGARLLPTGANLLAALHSLREESPDDWELFLQITRRVFPTLEDIRLPSAVRGYVQLAWHDRRFAQPFDASELSDGTLAFLASLCALMQPGTSLVAIDEPERHLHPEALYRLLGAARLQSHERPVVLATQSDRLLGFLDDIPGSVVVTRAGARGTELVRPEQDDLSAWLEEFSLADMRHELETWGQDSGEPEGEGPDGDALRLP